jgi:hypothetical protein
MMIRAIGFLLLASCLGFSIAADKAYGNRPRGVPAESKLMLNQNIYVSLFRSITL